MRATPQINSIPISYKGRTFQIEYFHRAGNKETVLFIHGLGGAKENYWEACKADILKDHTLICFDNPGTGNSSYFNDLLLNIDDLVEITRLFIDALEINSFILVGTSMGGLTTLLYLQRGGSSKVKAYINIEGNLMPEDCMFSSQVVSHDYENFHNSVYPKTIVDMKKKGNTGYHIIANNLQLNTNILSYYNYCFQTVSYSASGDLLQQYIDLNKPRLFIYGSENRNLSYLPELQKKRMATKEISDSNHFVFYDNPKEMYDVIGEFVHALKSVVLSS